MSLDYGHAGAHAVCRDIEANSVDGEFDDDAVRRGRRPRARQAARPGCCPVVASRVARLLWPVELSSTAYATWVYLTAAAAGHATPFWLSVAKFHGMSINVCLLLLLLTVSSNTRTLFWNWLDSEGGVAGCGVGGDRKGRDCDRSTRGLSCCSRWVRVRAAGVSTLRAMVLFVYAVVRALSCCCGDTSDNSDDVSATGLSRLHPHAFYAIRMLISSVVHTLVHVLRTHTHAKQTALFRELVGQQRRGSVADHRVITVSVADSVASALPSAAIDAPPSRMPGFGGGEAASLTAASTRTIAAAVSHAVTPLGVVDETMTAVSNASVAAARTMALTNATSDVVVGSWTAGSWTSGSWASASWTVTAWASDLLMWLVAYRWLVTGWALLFVALAQAFPLGHRLARFARHHVPIRNAHKLANTVFVALLCWHSKNYPFLAAIVSVVLFELFVGTFAFTRRVRVTRTTVYRFRGLHDHLASEVPAFVDVVSPPRSPSARGRRGWSPSTRSGGRAVPADRDASFAGRRDTLVRDPVRPYAGASGPAIDMTAPGLANIPSASATTDPIIDLEIELPADMASNYRYGDHVNVMVPRISLWHWHTFTLVPALDDDDDDDDVDGGGGDGAATRRFRVVIRAVGWWTKRLVRRYASVTELWLNGPLRHTGELRDLLYGRSSVAMPADPRRDGWRASSLAPPRLTDGGGGGSSGSDHRRPASSSPSIRLGPRRRNDDVVDDRLPSSVCLVSTGTSITEHIALLTGLVERMRVDPAARHMDVKLVWITRKSFDLNFCIRALNAVLRYARRHGLRFPRYEIHVSHEPQIDEMVANTYVQTLLANEDLAYGQRRRASLLRRQRPSLTNAGGGGGGERIAGVSFMRDSYQVRNINSLAPQSVASRAVERQVCRDGRRRAPIFNTFYDACDLNVGRGRHRDWHRTVGVDDRNGDWCCRRPDLHEHLVVVTSGVPSIATEIARLSREYNVRVVKRSLW